MATVATIARARTAVASARRGRSEDRAHSGESMQSNRNEEGCRLCPPEPMAAHGHVNGWREAEGFGGHSLSLTDIAIATGVPAEPRGRAAGKVVVIIAVSRGACGSEII